MKVQIQDCPREIASILRGVSGKGDRGHGPGVGEPRKYAVTLLSYSKWSFLSILQKHSKPEKKIKSKNKNVNSPFSKTRKLLSPESQTSGEGSHHSRASVWGHIWEDADRCQGAISAEAIHSNGERHTQPTPCLQKRGEGSWVAESESQLGPWGLAEHRKQDQTRHHKQATCVGHDVNSALQKPHCQLPALAEKKQSLN